MNIAVSVVIPAYNSQKYIEKTINCVKQQTHSNFEMIIVDDGSTDDTYAVAMNAAYADSRVKILRQPNMRVGAARNSGLREASGRFVAFLDADDLLHPTALSKHLNILSKEPTGNASFCFYRGIDIDDRILYSGTFWPVEYFNLNAHIAMQPVRNGSSLFVDRELALAVGGYATQYRSCEDLDFELKIAGKSPIRVVPEYLVGYRQSNEGMSSNKGHMIEGIVGVTKKHLTSNPYLTRQCLRWSLGRMYEDVAYNALISGNWKAAIWNSLSLAQNDPVSISWRLIEKICEIFSTRQIQDAKRKSLQSEDFLSVDPAYVTPESTLDRLRRIRLRRLLGTDLVM